MPPQLGEIAPIFRCTEVFHESNFHKPVHSLRRLEMLSSSPNRRLYLHIPRVPGHFFHLPYCFTIPIVQTGTFPLSSPFTFLEACGSYFHLQCNDSRCRVRSKFLNFGSWIPGSMKLKKAIDWQPGGIALTIDIDDEEHV